MAERDGVSVPARSREDIALAGDPRRDVRRAVARADREIALALEFAAQPHSQAEHIGALIGEMDWRSEKTRLLDELAEKLKPAARRRT